MTKQLVHSLGVLKQFRRALPRLHNIGLDMKADLQNLADQLAGRRVSRLSKLLALDVGLIGFFACFENQVAGAKVNPNLLEEGGRRSSAGKDPNEIVRDFLLVSCYIKDYRLGCRCDSSPRFPYIGPLFRAGGSETARIYEMSAWMLALLSVLPQAGMREDLFSAGPP